MVSNLNLMESRRRILLNTPHLESLSGSILSFKTDMASKLKECKIHFTPIQEGTGDPSPDNVRPISGHNGMTVYKTGKNLVDVEDMKSTYPWSSATYKSYALYVGADKEVTVSFKSLPESGKNFYFGISGSTSNSASMSWMYHKTVSSYNKRIKAVTTNSKGYLYITLYAQNTEGLNNFYEYILDNDFQVEFGSEATDYEPYTAQSLTIPFPQTIYGGYVDLVKGEVVEEWNSSTIDGNEVISNSSNGFYIQNAFPENAVNATENVSDKYKYSSTIYSSSPYGRFTIRNKTTYMTPPDGTEIARNDVNSFKAWLADNPVEICYKLDTPVAHPLDPVTIRTLKGLNNIFSDANGNIEIKYWTH